MLKFGCRCREFQIKISAAFIYFANISVVLLDECNPICEGSSSRLTRHVIGVWGTTTRFNTIRRVYWNVSFKMNYKIRNVSYHWRNNVLLRKVTSVVKTAKHWYALYAICTIIKVNKHMIWLEKENYCRYRRKICGFVVLCIFFEIKLAMLEICFNGTDS